MEGRDSWSRCAAGTGGWDGQPGRAVGMGGQDGREGGAAVTGGRDRRPGRAEGTGGRDGRWRATATGGKTYSNLVQK